MPATVPASQRVCRAPKRSEETTKDSQGEPAGGQFIERAERNRRCR
jgi:hypothetical protein